MTTPPGSADPADRRPREVTISGLLCVAGSAVVVVLLVITMQHLNSSQTTAAIDRLVKNPRYDVLGLTVESARTMLKYSIMVLAVLSAASLVLGWFVLRRHRSARVALTVLGSIMAALSLLGGPAGWVVTAYVTVCVGLLWTRQARTWFAQVRDRRPTSPFG